MTGLILIEGIPGSGKTTFAKKIAERYRQRSRVVNLFLEGPGHPVDLGWYACFSVSQYNDLIGRFNNYHDEIEQVAIFDGEYVLVPYSKKKFDDKDLSNKFDDFEVYTGRTRIVEEVCLELLCNRWKAFGEQEKNTNALNIFEAGFFQSQMERLLLWDNADDKIITTHLSKIMDTVSCLSPVLIYLSQPESHETILRIAKERVSEHSSWIESVISHCEPSPFWRQNNLSGLEGVLKFYTMRKRLELKIIDQLSIQCRVIENYNCDWDKVWAEIEMFLDKIE